MANEATVVDTPTITSDYTVSSSTIIEKGALLALTDPRTAILSSSAGQPIAGIAANEKTTTNSDVSTNLAVHKNGVFLMTASGAITVGQWVCSASTGSLNYVSGALAIAGAVSGASVIGYAEETAANNDRFEVRLTLA